MRLIDADALKAYIDAQKGRPFIGCTVGEALKIMTDEQPTVTPEPHWIPVEQALPELRHDVLLTVFFHEKWNVTEGYRQDGEFMFWNHGRLDSVLDEENRVMAWMPKPEPFKGVTDGRD